MLYSHRYVKHLVQFLYKNHYFWYTLRIILDTMKDNPNIFATPYAMDFKAVKVCIS